MATSAVSSMVVVIEGISGMTCGGCASNVEKALLALEGVTAAEVDHVKGEAVVNSNSDASRDLMEMAIREAGYQVGSPPALDWGDKGVWKQAAKNTKWCLIGCSIGEFGTLAAYSIFGIGQNLSYGDYLYFLLLALPLINGLITSVMLETWILMRDQFDFSNALRTAMGMSFISMLMMEIAMEITDLIFTGGQIGMNPVAIPFMLVVGFLTPWPYNYWRLKKFGKACH